MFLDTGCPKKRRGVLMKLVELVLKILEVMPILDKWFQEIALSYARQQREKENVEFTQAMQVATKEKDVFALSTSLGNKLDD